MKYTLVFDNPTAIGAWVADKVEQTASWGDFYAMGVVKGDQIVSGIVFNNFNEHNATVHIAVDTTGKHLIELLKHAATYAFKRCGLKRLTALIDASNPESLKINRHIGFNQEFVMQQAASDGGDMYVMVLWPENFKYGYDL